MTIIFFIILIYFTHCILVKSSQNELPHLNRISCNLKCKRGRVLKGAFRFRPYSYWNSKGEEMKPSNHKKKKKKSYEIQLPRSIITSSFVKIEQSIIPGFMGIKDLYRNINLFTDSTPNSVMQNREKNYELVNLTSSYNKENKHQNINFKRKEIRREESKENEIKTNNTRLPVFEKNSISSNDLKNTSNQMNSVSTISASESLLKYPLKKRICKMVASNKDDKLDNISKKSKWVHSTNVNLTVSSISKTRNTTVTINNLSKFSVPSYSTKKPNNSLNIAKDHLGTEQKITKSKNVSISKKENTPPKVKEKEIKIKIRQTNMKKNKTYMEKNRIKKKESKTTLDKNKTKANKTRLKHRETKLKEIKEKAKEDETKLKESETKRKQNETKRRLNYTDLELNQIKGKMNLLKEKLDQTKKKLNKTKGKLNHTTEELSKTKGKLNQTKGKLNQTTEKLNQTRGELNKTKRKLNQTEVKLNQAQEKLNKTKGKLNQAKGELNKTKGKLKKTRGKLNETKEKLSQTKGKLKQIKVNIAISNRQKSNLPLSYSIDTKRKKHIERDVIHKVEPSKKGNSKFNRLRKRNNKLKKIPGDKKNA